MFKKVVVNNKSASQLSKTGIRALLICIAMLTLGQSTGCKLGIKEASMLTYRDTVWSKRAYNLRYSNCDRQYSEHFESGFRAGYIDTSNGGDGYVPALPPQTYRAPEYQSEDGAKCVNSWFEGYPAGVAAAKKDKSGTYHDVLISRMIDSAVSQSKTNAVLPGDVKIVSGQRPAAPGGNQVRPGNVPNWNQQAPLASPLPSTLAPPAYAAPPQASVAPNPSPQVDLPPVAATSYAAATTPAGNAPLANSNLTGTGSTETEITGTNLAKPGITEDAVSDQPPMARPEPAATKTFSPLSPAGITPVNWNQTTK